MITLTGIPVCGGVAFGKIRFYRRATQCVEKRQVELPAEELARFGRALQTAATQLRGLHAKALAEVGAADAAIFEIHAMMLEDGDYQEAVRAVIQTQKASAEYAVYATGEKFAGMFAAMDDTYMRERAVDVKDISGRLVGILRGREAEGPRLEGPAILAAEDLQPSETVQLDKSQILAFVTRSGAANSHTAILARSMNIPAVVGVTGLDETADGRQAIVDGFTGRVFLTPDEQTAAALGQMADAAAQQKRRQKALKGKPNQTRDGHHIDLYANIGGVDDVAAALENDAGGIGLFRTEFLYLQGQEYPPEEVQLAAYRQVLEGMGGRRVVIRTLDIGADKQAGYFNLPKEENPALGLRAIRVCLERPEIFKTQLRALYRASVYGHLAIMLPMIISPDEVARSKQLIQTVWAELEAEGHAFRRDVELGAMIETPASVLVSDRLAPQVDFFSIGTNDLTQYTLAIDRQNAWVQSYYNPYHPAVLRSIRLVVENAHRQGIWVGICGELAADTTLTETFLALGVDELSVAPASILALREKIRGCNLKEVRPGILATL